MQDIDFDELDRAVSSVLGTAGRPASPAPATATADVTPAVPVAVSFTPPTNVPTVISTPAPIVTATTPINPSSNVHVTTTISPRSIINAPPAPTPVVTEPTIAKRNTGRFMDVVHPSSDMRSPALAPQPVSLPTPAPFDQAPAIVEQAAPVAAEPTFPALSYEDENDQAAPLETPFLTDAKVEKRPLGAFSDFEETAASAPKPPVFEPSLEISEEALIGSSETSDTDPKTIQQPEEPVLIPEKVEETKPETPSFAAQPARSGQPTTASIIQQYIEKPATDEEPSGAIFDTESYHQPLAHPQKKSSGFPTVLWIVGLILLGAGLGVALYFFVLQNL